MRRTTGPDGGLTLLAAVTAILGPGGGVFAQQPQVHYKTLKVGVIFYREAGPKGAPAVLLLHCIRPTRRCSAT